MQDYSLLTNKQDCINKINDIIVKAEHEIIIQVENFSQNEISIEIMKNLIFAANNNVSIIIKVLNDKNNVFIKQNNLEGFSDYDLYAMHIINHPLIKLEKTKDYSNYILVDDTKLLFGYFYFTDDFSDWNLLYFLGSDIKKNIKEGNIIQTKKGKIQFITKSNLNFAYNIIINSQNRITIVCNNIKSDKIIKGIKKIFKNGLKVNVITTKQNLKIKKMIFITNLLTKKQKGNMHLNILEKRKDFITNFIITDDIFLYGFKSFDNKINNGFNICISNIDETFRQEVLNDLIK